MKIKESKTIKKAATTATLQRPPLTKDVFKQLNRMLTAKLGQGEILRHNLEKGLGNEQAIRELLRDFLPLRFGVAKGKVINSEGQMSKQLDVIIYDALNCPSLFIDENRNQILPIEGVFTVIQVKTNLTSDALADAFDNLASVYPLAPRKNVSQNDYVTCCPPFLEVLAFSAFRSLNTVGNQFKTLSEAYPVDKSSASYTKKSPAFNGKSAYHLVSTIHILGKGCVRHMLDGVVTFSEYGEYTLGLFMEEMLAHHYDTRTPPLDVGGYINWFNVSQWRNVPPTKYKLLPENAKKKSANVKSGHRPA